MGDDSMLCEALGGGRKNSPCYDENITNVSTPVTCFLKKLADEAEGPIDKAFMNRAAVFIASVLILQYHLLVPITKASLHFLDREPRLLHWFKRQSGILRLIGRNIVILNIYYTGQFSGLEKITSGPFVSSLIVTFFESVMYWALQKIFALIFPGLDVSKSKRSKSERIVATRYADWSFPMPYVMLLIFAQSGLFILFITAMNEGSTSHKCNLSIYQWLISVAVTNVAGTEEVGSPYDRDVWVVIKKEIEKGDTIGQPTYTPSEENEGMLRSEHSRALAEHPAMTMSRYWVRHASDWVVNSFFREVILGLAPVMLAVVNKEDFIKDCLAIFFISKLDDIDNPKTLKESLLEWQGNDTAGEAEDRP